MSCKADIAGLVRRDAVYSLEVYRDVSSVVVSNSRAG